MDAPNLGSSDFALEISSDDAFEVREFTIDDGLSALFSVELVTVSSNPAVDLEDLVGKDATFKLGSGARPAANASASDGDATAETAWAGVVSEIHLLESEPSGLSTYHVTISPKLWLLTRRTNCRVFQQQTDLDVVKGLLAEWGIEPVLECTRAYKTRKTRVQYQETDFTFVCRLLEASGITFAFRFEDGASKLVLTDAPEQGPKREAPLDYVSEPMPGDHFVTQFRASRALRAGRTTFADHDPRLPNEPLTSEARSGEHPVEAAIEQFTYAPGAFKFGTPGPADTPVADDRGRSRTDPEEGKRIAEQAAYARVARTQRFSFDSNWLDLVPGLRVTVRGHAMAERYAELLITRASYSGSLDGGVRVACDAVAASVPYKPEMITPRPVLQGVESATVVGRAGETIDCDEFGRVRVQFHWDRYGAMNEQSSCWVPVSQPWAGDGHGAINIPRVGQEVMVGFLAGNPEEPMIVGRMFTNLLRPPVSLPADKTQNGFKSASVPATGGYNELMFEDAAGREVVRVRAERDMKTRVNNDQALSVGRNRSASIEGNDRESVSGSKRQSVVRDMMSAVGANQLTSVLGNLISAAGRERLFNTVGNFISEALTHKITSKSGTTLSVGASSIHIGPDAIVIQTPKLYLNPGQAVADAAQAGAPLPAPTPEA